LAKVFSQEQLPSLAEILIVNNQLIHCLQIVKKFIQKALRSLLCLVILRFTQLIIEKSNYKLIVIPKRCIL